MRQTYINAIIHSSVIFMRGTGFSIFVEMKKKTFFWIKFLISLLFFLIRSPAMSWSILQKVIKIFIELYWKLILPKTDMYRDCSFVVHFARKGYCWNVFRIHFGLSFYHRYFIFIIKLRFPRIVSDGKGRLDIYALISVMRD